MEYVDTFDLVNMRYYRSSRYSFDEVADHFTKVIDAYWERNANASIIKQRGALLRRLAHPFPFAQGMAVICSTALAGQLMRNQDVHTFFMLYDRYFASREEFQEIIANADYWHKCYLSTDGTLGLLVSFLPAVVAVDLAHFELLWTFPLRSK